MHIVDNIVDIKEQIRERTEAVERILRAYLPDDKVLSSDVVRAMNYSVNAGGKRLRPMLMSETYKLFGGNKTVIEPFMAAIEMIHTYSLVHDDLPAMDNDEYRRGKKTTWAQYGEAVAILAGDGLLNYAFETALKAFSCEGADVQRVAGALSILADKAGINGMIGGQDADIAAEHSDKALTLSQLLYIHEHKTAALIQASMMIGAVLAGADDRAVSVIERAAYEIGIAFQIQDDILDVTSTFEELGKPIGSDEKNNKVTYVTLKGIDEASREQKELSNHAIGLLEAFGEQGFHNAFLTDLVKSLITRLK